MTNNLSFQPDWVSPPGETISDFLSENNISLEDFSQKMVFSDAFTKKILKGKEPITQEIAENLVRILGSTSEFWINRELQYQNDIKYLESERIERQEWIKKLPIRDMVRFGWIKPQKSKLEKIQEVLDFFNVSNTEEWYETYHDLHIAASFRTSSTFDSEADSVIAWLRQGEIESKSLICKPWNPTCFREKLVELRSLSREKNPQIFIPKLEKPLAECGVALVVVPTPSKCSASGATFFISPEKALLLLSFRHLSDDHFWFSFYHEAGHILLHSNKSLFLEGVEKMTSKEEEEANSFAESILIPDEFQKELKSLRPNKWREIIRFAKKIGVSPGIVVGQLQHIGTVRHNQLNKLKTRYRWVDIKG